MKSAGNVGDQGGFTLLELLMAMVLSVIVMTAMSATFRSVVDSSVSIDSEVRINQEGRVLLNILQRDLSSLVVRKSDKEASPGSILEFNMSTGLISTGHSFFIFTSTNDIYDTNSTSAPMNRIEYKLEDEDEDLYSLIRSSREYSQLSGDWEVQELKICEKLKSFEVDIKGIDAGLTVEASDILKAKSIEIVFNLLENENVREFRLIVPVRPVVVELPDKPE